MLARVLAAALPLALAVPAATRVALELLTSDLLQPGITDSIERRRRATATTFTQQASWDSARRLAVLETTATAPQIPRRSDPSLVDWFPEPIFLAVLDDGVAPDRVWLADDELWPDRDRTPPRAAAASGDGAPARTRALAGAGQHAVLAVRVPLRLGPGERATRRFAFGMVPGGGTPDAAVAELRARATTLAADTARSWHDRLVWAAFPDLPGAAVIQRELAWSTYAAIANTSFDEYRGVRVLGQGGSYRFIHGLDGAMGDLALFAESMLLIDPGIARDTLAYAFATQLGGGQATPWRYPYATTGVGSFSDVGIYDRRSDAYWFLPSIVGKYVALTRDAGFLDEPVPYWPRAASETGSVREHIARGLDYALDEATLGIGARGLVAIGTNDYADGVLNLTSERPVTPTGSSSTYNAGMIVYGLPLAADLLEARDAALAARMRDVVTSQTAALLGEAWEGHYFWRGFVDSGNPLAPQLFFVEPQVFPVLADIVGPDRRDLALGEVVRRLETPIGAISNVAIGVQGPIGGIDQPQVGGVWPVANAWLTAAYARRDPLEAWSSFTRNTLAAHAQAYPALWYGIWTGPDSWNGADKPRPGEADAHIATALTDYPALNAHVHTSPLRALTDLVGVEGTRDGLRITPRVPTETFTVRWPRLSIESVPAAIAGALTTAATEPLMLEVLLPSGLRGGVPLAVIAGGAPAAYTLDGDVVRFALPPAPGAPVAWRIAATP
jgi:Glycosyl hydrolase 36 superfamily, catalytic domain